MLLHLLTPIVLTLFGFGLSYEAQASFSITIERSGLNETQYAAMVDVVAKVESVLPVKYKANLPAIQVRINPELKKFDVNSNSRTAHVYGRVSGSKIELHPIVLENKHLTGALYEKLDSVLIHEISHIYDNLNVHDGVEKETLEWCASLQRSRPNDIIPDPCILYKNTKTSISTVPAFLSLAGWFQTSADGTRQNKTEYQSRTISDYELTNSSEFFAVNMEAFILDPQYSCRRPNLYKFFSKSLNHRPFFKDSCIAHFYYVDPNEKDSQKMLKELDFSKLYQVHYILAGKGEAAMSSWGHSMFRLVMCAPTRKQVGPECMLDIHYHLVLSFRAFVNSPTLSTLGGLTGEYPSRLFIMSMNQIIEEYNKVELRDLHSYPLNLSSGQMRAFTIQALQTHWGYDGKYYFLTKNCAVESMHLLQSISSHPTFDSSVTLTPAGLFSKLKLSGLLDDSVLVDRKKAYETGYLFESYKEKYTMAYSQIKQLYANLPVKNFEEYLRYSARDRAQIYENVIRGQSSEKIRQLAASFMLLENRQEQVYKQAVYTRIAELYYKGNIDSKVKSEVKEWVSKETSNFDVFSKPAALLDGISSYGLPLDRDQKVLVKKLFEIRQESNGTDKQVVGITESLITSKEREQITGITENLKIFLRGIQSPQI